MTDVEFRSTMFENHAVARRLLNSALHHLPTGRVGSPDRSQGGSGNTADEGQPRGGSLHILQTLCTGPRHKFRDQSDCHGKRGNGISLRDQVGLLSSESPPPPPFLSLLSPPLATCPPLMF